MARKTRKPLDFGRLREALAGPGADTRSWLALARVDDDAEAISYEQDYGWIADVTITTGQLTGEGPIPCRVLSAFSDDEAATYCPVARGAEVLIAITDGDLAIQPVILGYLHNPTDSPGPSGLSESHLQANVVVRTTKGLDVGVANNGRIVFSGDDAQIEAEHEIAVSSTNVTVTGDQDLKLLGQALALADDDASQPFMRGHELVSALIAFGNALIASGAYTSSSAVVASATLIAAVADLSASLQSAKSLRIKGE